MDESYEIYVLASDIRAMRKARETLRVSRKELAQALNVSFKTIEKIENERMKLSKERFLRILSFLGLSESDILNIKKGRSFCVERRKRKVLSNKDRRSYKKIITNECRALKSLRRIRNISQDDASKLCGYSRATIGHIENGRIELDINRIKHIINSYGATFKEFQEILNQDKPRDIILDACILKLNVLEDEKLRLIFNLLESY